MPHTTSNIGPIVFVRWREEIFVTDVLSVEAEIKKLRARAGETLTVLWIVSADVKLMSDDVRLALGRTVHALKHVLRQIHVIVEGTTFLSSTYRSIFTPSRVSSSPGPAVALHDSVLVCLEHVSKTYNVDFGVLVKTATFQGVIP